MVPNDSERVFKIGIKAKRGSQVWERADLTNLVFTDTIKKKLQHGQIKQIRLTNGTAPGFEFFFFVLHCEVYGYTVHHKAIS